MKKMRMIMMLMKYAWWVVKLPNDNWAMKGLVMDLQGDLHKFRGPQNPGVRICDTM